MTYSRLFKPLFGVIVCNLMHSIHFILYSYRYSQINMSDSPGSPGSPDSTGSHTVSGNEFFSQVSRELVANDAVQHAHQAGHVDDAEAEASARAATRAAADAARDAVAAARVAADAARAAEFARAAADNTVQGRAFLYSTGARSAPNELARYRRTRRNNYKIPGGSRSKSKKYYTLKTGMYVGRHDRANTGSLFLGTRGNPANHRERMYGKGHPLSRMIGGAEAGDEAGYDDIVDVGIQYPHIGTDPQFWRVPDMQPATSMGNLWKTAGRAEAWARAGITNVEQFTRWMVVHAVGYAIAVITNPTVQSLATQVGKSTADFVYENPAAALVYVLPPPLNTFAVATAIVGYLGREWWRINVIRGGAVTRNRRNRRNNRRSRNHKLHT